MNTPLSKIGFSIDSQYHLTKASNHSNGIAKIEGILSTQSKDTQDETIFIAGMDISRLNSGMGQLNWWHLGTKDPSMVIGLFDRAEKIDNDTKVAFEAHLLDTKTAHAVLDLMIALESEGKKMGVSVEGQTIVRKDKNIYKCIATGGALATDQINKQCTAQLIKALSTYDNTLQVTEGLLKSIGLEGNAPYDTNPILQQASLGTVPRDLLLEEAVKNLKAEYPDLEEELIREILISIYLKNNVR